MGRSNCRRDGRIQVVMVVAVWVTRRRRGRGRVGEEEGRASRDHETLRTSRLLSAVIGKWSVRPSFALRLEFFFPSTLLSLVWELYCMLPAISGARDGYK